jgi:hypothetical protein
MWYLLVSFLLIVSSAPVRSQLCSSLAGTGYMYNNGSSLSVVPSPNLGFTASPNLQQGYPVLPVNGQRGSKQRPLGVGSWVMVQTSPAGRSAPGMIHRFWLALAASGTPSNGKSAAGSIYLSIVFDGASTPQVGAMPATPTYMNAILVDNLFAAGNNTVITPFRGDDFAVHWYAVADFGGNWAMDMPFQQSWAIYLYNADTISYSYWIQIEETLYESTYVINPSYYYLTINQNMNVGGTNYPNECPFISVSSANGVKLKYFKWFVQSTGSGSWIEGPFRIYSGGPGLTSCISGNHWTDGSDSVTSPYTAGATVLFESTGVEDMFLSSWGFYGETRYYAERDAGYIWCVNQFGNCINPTTPANGGLTAASCWFAGYRQWGGKETMGMPSAAANVPLILTWQVGSGIQGQSGSAAWIAYVGYYA